jgi:preprotein translocase subunit YajC
MRPGRRRRQQVDDVRRRVVPGAEVRTNAGLYATVVSTDEDYLLLEIAPGVQARFDPRVVVAVLSSPADEVVEEPPVEPEPVAEIPSEPSVDSTAEQPAAQNPEELSPDDRPQG